MWWVAFHAKALFHHSVPLLHTRLLSPHGTKTRGPPLPANAGPQKATRPPTAGSQSSPSSSLTGVLGGVWGAAGCSGGLFSFSSLLSSRISAGRHTEKHVVKSFRHCEPSPSSKAGSPCPPCPAHLAASRRLGGLTTHCLHLSRIKKAHYDCASEFQKDSTTLETKLISTLRPERIRQS